MTSRLMKIFLILIALSTLLTTNFANAQNKQIFGWVEKVRIYPADIVIHAKIDSGADYSSISATNIEKFKRSGSDWVRFTLKNRYGHKAVIEKKIVRVAKIKRHGNESSQRYVIRLGLCLGGTYMEEEVNLADRSQFDFQMLIGRSFLSGNVLIDPAQQYTAEPNCVSEENYPGEEDDLDEKVSSSSQKIPHQFNTGKPQIDLTDDAEKIKKTKANKNEIDTSEENWGEDSQEQEVEQDHESN